eukprot:19331-Heterococcus_DN1.PRE.2
MASVISLNKEEGNVVCQWVLYDMQYTCAALLVLSQRTKMFFIHGSRYKTCKVIAQAFKIMYIASTHSEVALVHWYRRVPTVIHGVKDPPMV